MTTGPESRWLKNEYAVAKKKDSVIISGHVSLTMSEEIGYDGTEINTIRFKACQDSRSIRLRMGDTIKKESLKWELDEVEMHLVSYSGKRRWLTYGQTAQKHNPRKPCTIR
jgi:hypothetical protein